MLKTNPYPYKYAFWFDNNILELTDSSARPRYEVKSYKIENNVLIVDMSEYNSEFIVFPYKLRTFKDLYNHRKQYIERPEKKKGLFGNKYIVDGWISPRRVYPIKRYTLRNFILGWKKVVK